jgi:cation transport protein ChaC
MHGIMKLFYVFGYGSLMWRPGFEFIERRPARLYGLHRSLCVLSHVHRGTPEQPGLVMGLDRGGSCDGVAYGIAPEAVEETLLYLRSREQVTMVYLERKVRIRFHDAEESSEALTYVVDRRHKQYAGALSFEEQLKFIHQGQGQSGVCRDYVLSTLNHLRDMKIHDERLERLALRLALPAYS